MTLPEPYYTAKALAGLPGMPGTERSVQRKADRENWPWRKHAGKGGGREYPLTSAILCSVSKSGVVFPFKKLCNVPVDTWHLGAKERCDSLPIAICNLALNVSEFIP